MSPARCKYSSVLFGVQCNNVTYKPTLFGPWPFFTADPHPRVHAHRPTYNYTWTIINKLQFFIWYQLYILQTSNGHKIQITYLLLVNKYFEVYARCLWPFFTADPHPRVHAHRPTYNYTRTIINKLQFFIWYELYILQTSNGHKLQITYLLFTTFTCI